MKLTKSNRDTFVRAVMNDVPMIDYNDIGQKIAIEESIKMLPDEIRKVYKKYPQFIKASHVWTPGDLQNYMLPCVDSGDIKNNKEAWEKLEAVAAQKRAQSVARETLKEKIRSVIYSCNTLAQAKKLLPEFEKYLPSSTDPAPIDRSLPVVANVVKDLMAAGWPKQGAAKK